MLGNPDSTAQNETPLTSHLPRQEANQPDPMLQMSVGRMGAAGVTLAAVIAVLILSVVLYGLNSPDPATKQIGGPHVAAANPTTTSR